MVSEQIDTTNAAAAAEEEVDPIVAQHMVVDEVVQTMSPADEALLFEGVTPTPLPVVVEETEPVDVAPPTPVLSKGRGRPVKDKTKTVTKTIVKEKVKKKQHVNNRETQLLQELLSSKRECLRLTATVAVDT